MVALSNTSDSSLDSEFQIRLRDMQRNAETVVARFTANEATHRFDFIRDLFRCAIFCAFQQRLRHQTRDPVGLRSLRKQSAAENCHHRDERQTRIFAHQNPQSILELELLNFCRGRRFHLLAFRGQRPFGLSETIVRF